MRPATEQSRARGQVTPYLAGIVYVGDPATATAATLDRLVRHVSAKLVQEDEQARQAAK